MPGCSGSSVASRFAARALSGLWEVRNLECQVGVRDQQVAPKVGQQVQKAGVGKPAPGKQEAGKAAKSGTCCCHAAHAICETI